MNKRAHGWKRQGRRTLPFPSRAEFAHLGPIEACFDGRGDAAQHSRKRCGHRPSAFPSRAKRASTTWLGWQDSNLRMPESKSGALPLGDIPISGIQAEIVQIVLCLPRLVAPGKAFHLYGVSDGTRTHGLQSHNLTR